MLDHLKEVFVDVILKKVVPSAIAGLSAVLMSHADELKSWGVTIDPAIFQKRALPLIMTAMLFLVHYAVHLIDQSQKPQGGQP